jgi:hypothetical protein
MPLSTAERIAQLQAEAEAHRAHIAEREGARERDPIAMADYLRSEHDHIPKENKVERDAGGLLFRQQDNALVSAPEAAADWSAWQAWLDGHLNVLRAEMMEAVAEGMAEFANEYIAEKLAPLQTELTDLRRTLQERDERAVAIAEVKKQYAGERAEREALALAAALTVRDAKIEKLEMQLGILLRFLSLSGLEPPKGL